MTSAVVAVTDAPFPDFRSAERVLTQIGAEVRIALAPTPREIIAVAHGADAVMVTYATVNEEVIQGLSRCRIIARLGIGLDNIDLAAATRAGIVVTNVPDYCIDEVSDHALGLLLALTRKIPRANQLVRGGGWKVADLGPVHRVRGQTLGLIGFGKIARALASKAQALGMKVVTHDPFVTTAVLEEAGVQPAPLDELLAVSDYVSLHAPLTPETQHLFSAQTFRQMKPTAFFINTARGGLVDERALAEALATGHLAGAALDVLEAEPPAVDSPLLGEANLIVTPHTAYYSEESTAELQRKAAEDVVRVLQGKAPKYLANPSVMNSPVSHP